jgi:hypothetical protein
MPGLTNAVAASTLDTLFPTSGSTSHIGWSENGTSESSALARTPVGATGWAAATVADPSVKSNNAILTSAAASGTATFTHFAEFTAITAGTQRTDWTALAASKAVTTGDQLVWAIGDLDITLT